MALIKCNECKKEVSENAKSCPNCGEPITKKGKLNLILGGIAVLILGTAFVYFIGLTDQQDTFESRKTAAKQVLNRDCNFVVNASTEFINRKNPSFWKGLVKSVAGTMVSSKCDCITDSLAVQIANEYTLTEIKDMQNQPIETIGLTVQKVIDKNHSPVKDCISKW